MQTLYTKGQPFRWMRLLTLLLLLPLAGRAQTFYDLSTGNYSQDFADIANWTNNFAAGAGANNYRTATSVATSPANQSAVFVTGASGGVQKGTLNIVLLATGTAVPSNAAAFDLLLNFSNRTAGNLSFDYAKVVNTANDANPRKQTLKIQYSIDNGVTFTDYTATGYTAPIVSNTTTAESGTRTIALPAALNNQATVVVRFFASPNGDNTGSGNRPKISIDNVAVTSTAIPTVTCVAPAAPTFSGTNSSSTSVAFVPDATNTSPYTVTATPTAGGTAITATGTSSPISLTGLAASTGYSVTVTATCTSAAGGGTVTSAAATVTTTAASASCIAPTSVSATPGSTSASIAFTGDATATGGYTVAVTPTAGGTAITATGTSSPITVTGLAPNTSYSVTVSSDCGGNGTATSSPAVTFATLAPNPEINVQVAGVDYLTGSTYDFGTTNFGTPVGPVTFTVQNTSTTDVLTVSGAGITSSTGAGFTLSAPSTPFTVAPSSTATFTVTFNPTTAGAKTGVVTITNNDQSEPSYVINLTGQSNTPPPTATNYSATSILAGIQSTEVVTGTSLSGATVTITSNTAGTVTVGTVTASSTQASFTLLATQAGSFTLNITTAGGSLTQAVTVTTPPTGFFEPFEAGTKATYPSGNVVLTTGSWNFTEALLGAQAPTATPGTGEKKNNGQAVRLRTLGTASMNFDKSGGAGNITFLAALYGTDAAQTSPASAVLVEISTDGGAIYTTVGSITPTATLASYTLAANKTGNVRLRFSSNTTGTTPRINLDDVQISDYALAVCDAPTGLTPGSITSSSATVSFTGSASAANGYTVTTMPVTTTQTPAAGATSVSFTGLQPGTTYAVSIVSNCSATSTSSAATTNFTTLALAPTLAVSQSGTSYPSGGTAYDFGNQTVNTTSSAVSFTLTNNGPDALTISAITTTGDYAVSGAAPTTVPAGGTATVNVTFTPTATGTRAGTLVISSNATNGGTYTVNLTGNGQAAALPDLTVTTGTPTSPTPITGNYNNVTIAPNGYAILAGPLTVAGTLTIQGGGGLLQGGAGMGCQLLTGSGNFNLQAGGTLGICDPAGISPTGVPTGAVLLTGTRTYSPAANYIYSGNVAQTTGLGLPSTVLGLGVQNAAGVTLSHAVSLTQGLNLSLGNLITNGQTFTLLSSNAGTAGVVNTGGVVVGTATVQRSINSSNAIGYRHYSAPVSNTTFADLTVPGVFTPTFNPTYNGSATPGAVTPFPTVFGYDQDRIATVTSNYSAFDKGWFSPNGVGDPMVVGKGYSVNAPNTALVDFMGNLNSGPVPSGTLNRGADAAAGWHLLGNPYPSPLDWSTVTPAQRPGMDAAIYVFESAGQYGGSYRASVNGVGGNANSPQPIVVSSQGYFVRVTTPNGTGQVNLDNSNRVTVFTTQPSFGRGTADSRPQVALTLQGASAADAAYVYFQAGATAGKDVEFDATKLANSHGLNLTSLAGGEALAINGLPALGTATVLVPLNVAAPQAGSYSLTAGSLANFAGTTVTLVDALTSTRTVLTAGTTYAFSMGSTTAAGRFALEFRPSGALATTAAKALAAQTQLFPNPTSASFRVQLPLLAGKTTVQATLANALGQTVLSRTLNAAAGQAIDAEFDVRALAAGVYTLRLNVNGIPIVRKVVVE
ncbi:hypothetical protein GCM10022409_40420 [Hymenobacter glaciei]|uniref:Fibronectin type-III domain-containing protein n=1 Tax=Hymenobacter glaciei TaxID=877209 RepID=A0ABP7UQ67_9BACT